VTGGEWAAVAGGNLTAPEQGVAKSPRPPRSRARVHCWRRTLQVACTSAESGSCLPAVQAREDCDLAHTLEHARTTAAHVPRTG